MMWTPSKPLILAAGTPPGGGLDRVARALAKAIDDTKRLSSPVDVINVPGDGARRVWTTYIDQREGDAHVVSISSPNLVTDYLVGVASFSHERYTPIATLVTEYIAFGVRADSAIKSGKDWLARLKSNPSDVTVALSTALGNPNHVAFAKLLKAVGSDITAPAIRVFDTALDAVADVLDGKSEVCAVTAASVFAPLKEGRMRVIGLTAPRRLAGDFANAPTWSEQGVDCVIGAWRGVTGPVGLSADQVAFWQDLLRAAVAQPSWTAELARLSWSPLHNDGVALDTALKAEKSEFVSVLGELGLLKQA